MDYFQFMAFLSKQPVFASLVGVLVGSLLTYFVQTSNEKRKEKRQDESIKVWLKIEIDRNIAYLKVLCYKVRNKDIPYIVKKNAEIETLAYLDVVR